MLSDSGSVKISKTSLLDKSVKVYGLRQGNVFLTHPALAGTPPRRGWPKVESTLLQAVNKKGYFSAFQYGFSIIEMAIVLGIIAILVVSLLGPLSMQEEIRRIKETERRIENIKEALLGFAIANDRLPCPASNGSNGVEDPNNAGTGVACGSPLTGFVPASTLGITPTDANGFALDAWQNRIRYSVATVAPNMLTTTDAIQGTTDIGNVAVSPSLLRICNDAACGAGDVLTDKAAAVVYSLGPNLTSASVDEAENTNGSNDFVSTSPRDTEHPDGEFDDVVSWISINVLFNRMVLAGQLP